jgi:hypothetical protein
MSSAVWNRMASPGPKRLSDPPDPRYEFLRQLRDVDPQGSWWFERKQKLETEEIPPASRIVHAKVQTQC